MKGCIIDGHIKTTNCSLMGINPSNGLIEIILLKVLSLMDILKQPNTH